MVGADSGLLTDILLVTTGRAAVEFECVGADALVPAVDGVLFLGLPLRAYKPSM